MGGAEIRRRSSEGQAEEVARQPDGPNWNSPNEQPDGAAEGHTGG